MHRLLTFRRLGVIFFAVFAVLSAGVLVFQQFWVTPGERCEARGYWYDIETRVCAQPLYIPDITGRPEGTTRAEASNTGNRELLRLEDEYAAQQRATKAAIDKQREALKGAR